MMTKRVVTVALLFVILLLPALYAAAQDDPEVQPTIDAFISGAFTQTAEAGAPNMTATLAAAFEAAVTATAQASAPQATPTPTPVAPLVDVASLEVVDTTEFELLAGPARTSAFLSPDGERIAYFSGRQFCILDAATGEEQVCSGESDFDLLNGIDVESTRWSPDSRWLVFTPDALRRFVDSDLLMLDVESGDVINLTDDNFDDDLLALDEDIQFDFDIAPCWTPDNRIAFLRYANGIRGDASIAIVSPAESSVEIVGAVPGSNAIQAYTLACAPSGTQFAYNIDGRADEDMAGIWLMDAATGASRRLVELDPSLTPFELQFSPDEQYILSLDLRAAQRLSEFTAEMSGMRVTDLATGKQTVVDPERFVVGAGWLPGGHALAYTVRNLLDEAINGVYLTAEAGEAGRLVYQDNVSPHSTLFRQALIWGANNRLLVSRSPVQGIVVLSFE